MTAFGGAGSASPSRAAPPCLPGHTVARSRPAPDREWAACFGSRSDDADDELPKAKGRPCGRPFHCPMRGPKTVGGASQRGPEPLSPRLVGGGGQGHGDR